MIARRSERSNGVLVLHLVMKVAPHFQAVLRRAKYWTVFNLMEHASSCGPSLDFNHFARKANRVEAVLAFLEACQHVQMVIKELYPIRALALHHAINALQ